MSPSPVRNDQERGWIVPVGGAEDKLNNPTVLNRFIELAGGDRSRIVVIPTASQLDDTGSRYEQIFRELGAGTCDALGYAERVDADRDDWYAKLQEATGVFFTTLATAIATESCNFF